MIKERLLEFIEEQCLEDQLYEWYTDDFEFHGDFYIDAGGGCHHIDGFELEEEITWEEILDFIMYWTREGE